MFLNSKWNDDIAHAVPYFSQAKEISMSEMRQAIVAGGCFWCTEAVFRDVVGVSEVESGYIGGSNANPTYKEVCSG